MVCDIVPFLLRRRRSTNLIHILPERVDHIKVPRGRAETSCPLAGRCGGQDPRTTILWDAWLQGAEFFSARPRTRRRYFRLV